MTYARTKPLSIMAVDETRKAFAISRGFKVHQRGEPAPVWYIVGPRDAFDSLAKAKGQDRAFTSEAEAWYAAWQRATAADKRR